MDLAVFAFAVLPPVIFGVLVIVSLLRSDE
jgi:hypothetical protein